METLQRMNLEVERMLTVLYSILNYPGYKVKILLAACLGAWLANFEEESPNKEGLCLLPSMLLLLLCSALPCAWALPKEAGHWGALQAQEAPEAAGAVVAQQVGGAEEVDKRISQVKEWSARHNESTESLEQLIQHPAIKGTIANAIILNNGRYWSDDMFREHVNDVYIQHNQQTGETRRRLREHWNAQPVVGDIKVWDLLRLLHFTIDNTDRFLGYTSQFIHCLQVFNAIESDRDARFDSDPTYREDMLVAGLIHDFGKTLSLLGESDNNTDCMNRVVSYGPAGGLDGLEFQWNHDMMGHDKVAKYDLPQRVKDVVKFHSLRELGFLLPPKKTRARHRKTLTALDAKHTYGLTVLVDRGTVTSDEIALFNMQMSEADRERAEFVKHFSGFDAGTKRKTFDIPETNIDKIHALLNK